MNEGDFFRQLAKVLNSEDTFDEIERKKQKERRMLESLGAHLGVEVDLKKEEIKIPSKFVKTAEDVGSEIAPVVVEEIKPQDGLVVENVVQPMPELPLKDIVNATVEKIAATPPPQIQKVVDEIPNSIRKELDILKKSVTDFHRFAQRHSQMAGGGEVNFRYLDDVNRSTLGSSNDNWVLEYDAATKKVQFTENIGPVRSLKMNTQGPNEEPVDGQLSWNVEEDCLNIYQSDGSTLQTGLEQYIRVHNGTGSTLTNGTVVRFAGVHVVNSTNEPTVLPHIANGSVHSLYTLGVLTNDILDGEIGRSTWHGKVRNLDTTGSSVGEVWAPGDLLYVSAINPGKLTKVAPSAPDILIKIATVLRAHATLGALFVRPELYPRLYYGSFSDIQPQVATTINTPYAVRLRTTDIASGHHIDNDTRVVAEFSGCYNYQFSLQIASTSASKKEIYIWARKNGTDVTNSATRLTITGNDEYNAPAWNFIFPMAVNDYFELMWATSDTGVSVVSPPVTAFSPAIPSAILTVTQAAL